MASGTEDSVVLLARVEIRGLSIEAAEDATLMTWAGLAYVLALLRTGRSRSLSGNDGPR